MILFLAGVVFGAVVALVATHVIESPRVKDLEARVTAAEAAVKKVL